MRRPPAAAAETAETVQDPDSQKFENSLRINSCREPQYAGRGPATRRWRNGGAEDGPVRFRTRLGGTSTASRETGNRPKQTASISVAPRVPCLQPGPKRDSRRGWRPLAAAGAGSGGPGQADTGRAGPAESTRAKRSRSIRVGCPLLAGGLLAETGRRAGGRSRAGGCRLQPEM